MVGGLIEVVFLALVQSCQVLDNREHGSGGKG
jgi:hypothetical protein